MNDAFVLVEKSVIRAVRGIAVYKSHKIVLIEILGADIRLEFFIVIVKFTAFAVACGKFLFRHFAPQRFFNLSRQFCKII